MSHVEGVAYGGGIDAKRETAVPRELNDLDKAVALLDERVVRLAQRLEPVLMPHIEIGMAGELRVETAPDALPPIAARLMRIRSQINSLSDLVASHLDRLEV